MSPPPIPPNLSGLAEGAQLLVRFPTRGLTKYRLLRHSRIMDVYTIPQSDFGQYAVDSDIHVLLVPVQHDPTLPPPPPAEVVGRSSNSGIDTSPVAQAVGPVRHPPPGNNAWRASSWPDWASARRSAALFADYARLGSTVHPPPEGRFDGTAVVYAPLSFGEPMQWWPTSVPLSGARKLVVSFQPQISRNPAAEGQVVERLITLHRFDWPAEETVVLFKPGSPLPSEEVAPSLETHGDETVWLAELLGTLFDSVPSHNLGHVTIVGLEGVAPSWPRDQDSARAELDRTLDRFITRTGATDPGRDWSDIKNAHFLSLDAYEATVTSAEFELETRTV